MFIRAGWDVGTEHTLGGEFARAAGRAIVLRTPTRSKRCRKFMTDSVRGLWGVDGREIGQYDNLPIVPS